MEKNNYMQVGRSVACGHCQPELYGEGLKQAEKMAKDIGQVWHCDCICHDNPQKPLENLIVKEFREKFAPDNETLLYGIPPKEIEQFILQSCQKVEEEVKKECIELSEKIELGGDTTFEEWKAFKKFRNTLRDKLTKLTLYGKK